MSFSVPGAMRQISGSPRQPETGLSDSCVSFSFSPPTGLGDISRRCHRVLAATQACHSCHRRCLGRLYQVHRVRRDMVLWRDCGWGCFFRNLPSAQMLLSWCLEQRLPLGHFRARGQSARGPALAARLSPGGLVPAPHCWATRGCASQLSLASHRLRECLGLSSPGAPLPPPPRPHGASEARSRGGDANSLLYSVDIVCAGCRMGLRTCFL